MSETEAWEFTRRERAYLIDAVMILMHQMEQSKTSDRSELPDLQALLDRLMSRDLPGNRVGESLDRMAREGQAAGLYEATAGPSPKREG